MAKKNYGHPLRSTWYAMIRRCHHTNDARYKDYGARGIVVCDRWRSSFDSFASDMGAKPSPLHTLDRINNDGNYEPSNCRWADKKTQNSNTRNTLVVTWDGKTQTMSQWARDLGISNGTLWNRLQNMTVEDAMTQSIDELSRVRKWTLSEIDTVLEMHQNGKALRVIAEEVHASKECVKRLIWRLTPIPKTPAQPATAAKQCACNVEFDCNLPHHSAPPTPCGYCGRVHDPLVSLQQECIDALPKVTREQIDAALEKGQRERDIAEGRIPAPPSPAARETCPDCQSSIREHGICDCWTTEEMRQAYADAVISSSRDKKI
jgi:hypothetical protein